MDLEVLHSNCNEVLDADIESLDAI